MSASLFQYGMSCAPKASVGDLFTFLLAIFQQALFSPAILEEQVKIFQELYHYEENVEKNCRPGP